MVRIIWPMGAASTPTEDKLKDLFVNEHYVADIKLSGERVTVHFMADCNRIFTRSGSKEDPSRPIEITHRWPHLANLKCDKIPIGTVLDGEAFSPIRKEEELAGILNYKSTAKCPGDLRFIVFDAIYWGDDDLRNEPWYKRRAVVELAVTLIDNILVNRSAVTDRRKEEFFLNIINNGGEGVVLKNIFSTYHEGKKPVNCWIKVKKVDTHDCVILGFKPGKNKFEGMIGSIIIGQYINVSKNDLVEEWELVPVGAAYGINDEIRKHMTDNPETYIGRVITVNSLGRTGKGAMGFALKNPTFVCVRPEGSKDPRDCKVE